MHFRGWLGAHRLLPTISGAPLMLPGAIGGAVRVSDNTVHVGAARVLDDAGGLPPAWDAPPLLRLTGGVLLASESLRGSAFTQRLGNLASSSASAFVSVSAVMLRNVAQNSLAWSVLISCGVSSAVQLLGSLVAALQPKLCARQWLSMVLPAVVMQTNAGDTAHTAQATNGSAALVPATHSASRALTTGSTRLARALEAGEALLGLTLPLRWCSASVSSPPRSLPLTLTSGYCPALALTVDGGALLGTAGDVCMLATFRGAARMFITGSNLLACAEYLYVGGGADQTADNRADILTKALPRLTFMRLRGFLLQLAA